MPDPSEKDQPVEAIVVLPTDPGQRPDRVESGPDPEAPVVGRWYWTAFDGHMLLACVTSVGTNYAELKPAGRNYCPKRVHFDGFFDECKFEPSPDAIVAREVSSRQAKVISLMRQAQEITARLSISNGPALGAGGETQALALRGAEQPVEEYKAALVLAKEKQLPEIFEEIEDTNRALASWMKASIIPLIAQANGLKPVIGKIKDRIFSVELYAGLVEDVVQVMGGEPAPFDTKVHLLQRRCYMDEECLANYTVGGMEFKDISAFDAWLGRPDNLGRILPFPRCIAAFQVRRNEKHREWHNVRGLLKMFEKREMDKATFLYIRNGEQLFRLSTGIDFGAQLFPDMSKDMLDGKIYAEISSDGDGNVRVLKVISEGHYQEMVAEEHRVEKELAEKRKKAKPKDRWQYQSHTFHDSADFHPLSPDSVYHDDILGHVQADMERHNRLALVLQGLLDRSPVLHPHPPWSLWNPDGFRQALELVYDDSRALTPGDAPDFEAYRSKCNESLKAGSVTVGQEDAWERMEARKECARMERDHRIRRSDWRPSHHRPHGNPGPGGLARVYRIQPKVEKVTYAWNREKQTRSSDDDGTTVIRCTYTCRTSKILNVDAYKPGDFKIFFGDPRTRADYLEWAPILLEAEEYHAGNRKVPKVPAAPPPKEPSWEGRRRYANRKQRKALMGKAVRLTCDVTMKNNHVYKMDTLWRVVDGSGTTVCVRGILTDGTYEKGDGYRVINGLGFDDVAVDPTVPGLPEKPKSEPEPKDDDDDEDDED